MAEQATTEQWSSRLGAVLAVAGSAIGLGNFLRFPGLAAQYGGGAFMIAYFCAFLLLGIPLSWVEWSIGRRGGVLGAHSCAGIFERLTRSRRWRYVGVFALLTPLSICMYYMYLQSWTLGYAYHTAMGHLELAHAADYEQFFADYVGAAADGSAWDVASTGILIFFALAFAFNLFLIYRGVSRGIERFCKISMPVLLVTSLVILVRVLTLGTPDPAHPERSINSGLGYMWNPDKVVLQVNTEGDTWKTQSMLPPNADSQQEEATRAALQSEFPGRPIRRQHITLAQGLMNPDLWFAAISQIFYSLSVGFGIVCTYASYARRRQDIALSSLSANAANECVEVGIAGMMIVPAAVSFLGVAAAAGASTFGLGFNVLPQVFAVMPGGRIIGTLFFLLLSLAAVNGCISLIQNSLAFVEESWGLRRRHSVALVGFLLGGGSLIVATFSGGGLLGLSTLDFWCGQLCVFLVATCYLIIFRFYWGVPKGLRELRLGADFPIPRFLGFIISWISPSILLAVFVAWLCKNTLFSMSPEVRALVQLEPGAVCSLAWVAFTALVFLIMARTSRHA